MVIHEQFEQTIQEKDKVLRNFEQQIADLREENKVSEQSRKDLKSEKEELKSTIYDMKLQKVVQQLDVKWKEWFWVQVFEKDLHLVNTRNDIKDEQMSSLLKDIMAVLEENNLLSLYGFRINCKECENLTDKSIKDLATTLSTESLHLQNLYLYFNGCKKLTDDSLADLTNAIRRQSESLKILILNFPK